MSTELAPLPRPDLPAPPSSADVVADWLRGKSPRTLRAYRFDLNDFARYCGLVDPVAAADVLMAAGPAAANRQVLAYRNEMKDRRKLSPNTINRRLNALRSLVKLGRKIGRITWALDVDQLKVKAYRDTRGPGREGWIRIKAKAAKPTRADRDGRLALRNAAIVLLAHDLLLRRGEIVGMDLADVDLEAGKNGEIKILGKGQSEKEVLTLGSDPLRSALAAWIAVRGPAPGPLFIRLDRAAGNGEIARLTGDSVDRMVGCVGLRAGLKRRARAHGLRHQGITRALEKTKGDVVKVKALSRHVKVETLMIYNDRRKDDAGEVSRLLGEDD